MKVVVLGAGIAGHTCAMILKRDLGKKHDVIVVAPTRYYQWIPSNIWIGVGRMKPDQVRFQLNKVYDRWGIIFRQAKAVSINPEGDASTQSGFVTVEYTSEENKGIIENIEYDFLVNATGPYLNFKATPGLGPEFHSHSVCRYDHAVHAWEAFQNSISLMRKGKRQRFLIGTGHPTATCQGAALEYALNISFELKRRKLSHMAEIIWISNEYELGDFGLGGAFIKRGGYVVSTRIFTESIFAENGINWIKRTGVHRLEPGRAYYETLDGKHHMIDFDFAMLLPAFSGQDIKVYDRSGADITLRMFNRNRFMLVDADYSARPYKEWTIRDWPEIYQSPVYNNIYAPGIAFAVPHAISKPMSSPNGTAIYPTPPRTGMPSGVMGKIVAQNIAWRINNGTYEHRHKANMGRMGAACIISSGYSLAKGMGATITVAPIVPDWEVFPEWGRHIDATVGEIGLAGHWIKLFLHYMFLYKAKGSPFWWIIPE